MSGSQSSQGFSIFLKFDTKGYRGFLRIANVKRNLYIGKTLEKYRLDMQKQVVRSPFNPFMCALSR
jgi:hypothetical protein